MLKQKEKRPSPFFLCVLRVVIFFYHNPLYNKKYSHSLILYIARASSFFCQKRDKKK